MADVRKENPILDGLLDRRTVVLDGKIDQSSASQVGRGLVQLQLMSSDPINLIIDSGGGDIDAALQICDFITAVLTAPVRAIVIGSCCSAATFVLLHCAERMSTPYAQFLVHSGTMSRITIPIDQTTPENLSHLLEEAKSTEERVIQLYMEKLSKSRDEVRKLISRGDQNFNKFLSADEAKEVGLITHVVRTKLDIFT